MPRVQIFALASLFALSLGCGSDDDDGGTTGDGAPVDSAHPGSGGDAAVAADTDGTGGAPVDAADAGALGDGAASDGGGSDAMLSTEALRGKYVAGILGCAGCHTPKVMGTTMPDQTMALAGVDCFVSTPGCLSSANLTPDVETGLGGYSDQAIIDVLRTGKDPAPDAVGKFIFGRMPYYQFANLSDADAHAIVAYLRALPAVKHAVKEPTAPFDQAPTAAEWLPVDPAKLPAPSAGAPADAANGKYLATIMCSTCHSPDATGMPKHVAEATAFQGGQSATIMSNGATMMFQSANLTPDATGIKDWTPADVVTSIKTAKDKMAKTLCAPMRANTAITDADATAIADYLLALPPVAHAVNACMVRM